MPCLGKQTEPMYQCAGLKHGAQGSTLGKLFMFAWRQTN